MAQVKVNVKGLSQKIKELEKVLNNKRLFNALGEASVTYIKGETRTGKYIGTNKPQKALAQSTIENRKYLAKYNSTHPVYKAARSNLTIRGNLLDSLTFKATSKTADLFFQGTSIPYKGKKGRHKSQGLSNQDVADHLASQGRKIIGFNKALLKILREKTIAFLRRSLLNK